MNFAAFQKFREELLCSVPDIRDCAETNLYRAYFDLVPRRSHLPPQTVHRCHLASQWAECFGFAPDISRRALVSCGVRDSLARLFCHLAREKGILWIPSDNYPVYGDLALMEHLKPREFATVPEPVWPDAPPSGGPEYLLLTNPLKPAGRYLTGEEIVILKNWLAAGPARRLLIDAVYTFDTRFHSGTLALLETGQAILLHSLTKGWLHPRLFGVTLVPEEDAAALNPIFRVDPPPQENLARARELMSNFASLPGRVSRKLTDKMQHFRESLRHLPLPPVLPSSAPGYFLTTEFHWKDLLMKHNVLGIPGRVFGSARYDLTILSSLKPEASRLIVRLRPAP